jgi:hypothetical protein
MSGQLQIKHERFQNNNPTIVFLFQYLNSPLHLFIARRGEHGSVVVVGGCFLRVVLSSRFFFLGAGFRRGAGGCPVFWSLWLRSSTTGSFVFVLLFELGLVVVVSRRRCCGSVVVVVATRRSRVAEKLRRTSQRLSCVFVELGWLVDQLGDICINKKAYCVM